MRCGPRLSPCTQKTSPMGRRRFHASDLSRKFTCIERRSYVPCWSLKQRSRQRSAVWWASEALSPTQQSFSTRTSTIMGTCAACVSSATTLPAPLPLKASKSNLNARSTWWESPSPCMLRISNRSRRPASTSTSTKIRIRVAAHTKKLSASSHSRSLGKIRISQPKFKSSN